jgi:hypothetical protein
MHAGYALGPKYGKSDEPGYPEKNKSRGDQNPLGRYPVKRDDKRCQNGIYG